MMITVDPAEMIAASETLRICSIEAADIGTQLWACAQCPMPPDIQGVVDQLVVAADRAMDSVAGQLLAQAVDLTKRAIVALSDSQAATMAVGTSSTPGPAVAGVSVLGGTMVIGGTNPNLGIAGYSPFDGMTIGSVGGVTGGLTVGVNPNYGETGIVGGNAPLEISITNPDGSPASPLPTTITIGAPDYSQGPASGYMALAEVGQGMRERIQRQIDAIVNDPFSTPADIAAAMRAQDSLGADISHQLAPSWDELDRRFGYHLSESEVRMYSPYTLPRSMSGYPG